MLDDLIARITSQEITMLLVATIIIVVALLVMREFCCWYFKLNKLSSLLGKQNEQLEVLIELMSPKEAKPTISNTENVNPDF